MDNRKVFIISLLLPIIGGFVLSDWQSIGNDPCSATSIELPQLYDVDYSSPLTSSSEIQHGTNYTNLQLRKACEALSTPEDKCYWNPVSQFTGKYCQTCRPVCRSVRRSLNFFQTCIGIGLVTIAIPIGVAASTVVASDFVSLEMQVCNVLYCHIYNAMQGLCCLLVCDSVTSPVSDLLCMSWLQEA